MPRLNLALVLFALHVVADTDEENIACVLGHLIGVVAVFYLCDGL